MPNASRCPKCRDTIHPFAATCPSCLADLDAYRRRAATGRRYQHIRLPALTKDVTDLVFVTVVMLLLALFAPLYGVILALFILWHAHYNALVARRNAAVLCAGLAIFNLVFPQVLFPHLLPFLI
jgi:hypothetical protein